MRKGQTAFEYSSTYAWGLLVAVVAIAGIIIYQNAYSVVDERQEACRVGPQFNCLDAALDVKGNLEIKFVNNINSPIKITSFEVTDFPSNCIDERDDILKPGETVIVQCKGEEETGEIIGYRPETCEFSLVGTYYCHNVLCTPGEFTNPQECDESSVNMFDDTIPPFYYYQDRILCGDGRYLSVMEQRDRNLEVNSERGVMCSPVYSTSLTTPYIIDDKVSLSYSLGFKTLESEEVLNTFGEADLVVVESFGFEENCDFDNDDYLLFSCGNAGEFGSDCDDSNNLVGLPFCNPETEDVASMTQPTTNDCTEGQNLDCISVDSDPCNNYCGNEDTVCDYDNDNYATNTEECIEYASNNPQLFNEGVDCNDNNENAGLSACYNNGQCTNTYSDICLNPGQCNAVCFTCDADGDGVNNSQCNGIDQCDSIDSIPNISVPVCNNNDECGTGETCENAGTCTSECVEDIVINCNEDGDLFISVACGGTDLCDNDPDIGRSYFCGSRKPCPAGVCVSGDTCNAHCEFDYLES